MIFFLFDVVFDTSFETTIRDKYITVREKQNRQSDVSKTPKSNYSSSIETLSSSVIAVIIMNKSDIVKTPSNDRNKTKYKTKN